MEVAETLTGIVTVHLIPRPSRSLASLPPRRTGFPDRKGIAKDLSRANVILSGADVCRIASIEKLP
ncbi:hypothetical protein BC938DRAFT_478427 [Jimgerdemannia flammicorona]|uniref:Uncharacterized protein n=1 Tax=Jimgerdemannia flammicorona TaxID=994334 RepID=A0A433QMX1_9FUNG|nr:hypothetical protein BC938DRAFT_478427 [Jimgerdemannia flammicorona]